MAKFLLLVALLGLLVAQGEAWYGCKKADYTCLDGGSFCQAGKRMRCPAGTRCKTPKKYHGAVQRSPCVTDTRGGDCPWGEFVCASKWSFCLGGQEMACAPGTVCNGFAPWCARWLHATVYHTFRTAIAAPCSMGLCSAGLQIELGSKHLAHSS
jgi:hypothetical protein